MKQPVVLKVYRGEKLESVRQFEDKQIVIGREGEVQLQLTGDDISPIHAMIEDRDGNYFLNDLGSKTGTRLNGEMALEDQIHSGDEIFIGPYRLQFHVGVPKTATPPPARTETFAGTVSRDVSHFDDDEETTETDFDFSLEPVAPILTSPSKSTQSVPPPQKPVSRVATPIMPTPQTPSRQPGMMPQTLPAAPRVAPGAPPPIPQAKKDEDKKRSPFVMPTSKKGKTFAPPSKFKEAKEFVKPGKGTAVEVLVLWHERVLSTYHFFEKKPVFIGGGQDADVVVPILSSGSKYQLLKLGTGITVCLSPEMTGELVRENNESYSISELGRQNKIRNVGGGYEVDLRQGEMLRIDLQNGMISLMIRYKNDTPKPAMAPLLDLTASEVTGVILAGVISAIFFLYMSLYAPANLMDDEARIEEPIRKAVVTFNHFEKMPEPEKPPEPPKEEKKKVVEVTEKKASVQAEKKSESLKPQKADMPKAINKPDPGKAAEVAPKDTKDKTKKLTSAIKQGAAIKTAPKEGAQMKSDKPDPTKMGLLSTFGKGGAKASLDKAVNGAGELAGLAQTSNGMAGSDENRAGDTLGGKLKDTGAGGKGTATYGIAGVGTNGRGTGNTGYGTGGLGGKGSTKVDVGGQDASFTGSIDKEAIRRVILAHKAEIRFCYDKELQKNPGLAGKISIGWNITESGSVQSASVENNEMGNATVANCIVSKLKTWGFPQAPPDVLAHVTYPFVFASN